MLLPFASLLTSHAQSFDVLTSFNTTDGFEPRGALVEYNGNLYGTTILGGANGVGTIFEMTPTGALNALYSFCAQPSCADGDNPVGGLVLGPDGQFYGVTQGGGLRNAGCDSGGCGTIFKIDTSGTLTTLYSFCSHSACADGEGPTTPLVVGKNGKLYGTTPYGGLSCYFPAGCGTLFEITTNGALTTLYRFCSQANCADGVIPENPPVLDRDGNLYGTTYQKGLYGYGTVFKLSLSGVLTTLHDFCAQGNCVDGAVPLSFLQARDGNFYGTAGGGAFRAGIFFEITPTGTFTELFNFCAHVDNFGSCTDGDDPYSLLQASDGNFYGVTGYGGAGHLPKFCPNTSGCGVIFGLTSTGELLQVHSFCTASGCPSGTPPNPLMQATDGSFYGTAQAGGTANDCVGEDAMHNCGTAYRFSAKTVPND